MCYVAAVFLVVIPQKFGKKLALSPNACLFTPLSAGSAKKILLKLHIFRGGMNFLPKEILKAQNNTGGTQCRDMREEGDQMTPEEVIKVRKVITELYKVASRLSKGKSYSRENRVDTSTYVNKLLKQTNGETLRNEKAQ